VSFPIKKVIFHSYVSLPEGTHASWYMVKPRSKYQRMSSHSNFYVLNCINGVLRCAPCGWTIGKPIGQLLFGQKCVELAGCRDSERDRGRSNTLIIVSLEIATSPDLDDGKKNCFRVDFPLYIHMPVHWKLSMVSFIITPWYSHYMQKIPYKPRESHITLLICLYIYIYSMCVYKYHLYL
jgi:hypothetical protein